MPLNRILVTGAAGFLGSEIVRQAKDAGCSVTATDRVIGSGTSGVDFIQSDILNPADLSKVCANVDCVCHAAGLAHVFSNAEALAAQFHAVNVVGAENVARAAISQGVKQFVLISSVSVYGGMAQGKDEPSECRPEGPYAESKWRAEQQLVELCEKEGLNLAILRLATLYGEEDPGNVARLVRSINRGRFIWIGRGENLKSLLHREDAARACIAVMKLPAPGIHIYNVSAPPCKMRDVVGEISFACGRPIPSWHIPASFALACAKVVKSISFKRGKLGTVHHTIQKWLADDYYNSDKFRRTFNFRTQVGLGEGIRREVAWCKDKFAD